MFSGIVEAVGTVTKAQAGAGVLRLWIERPSDFTDLKIGDSIATNGVCLTLESQDSQNLVFALAAETLAVLGEAPEQASAWIGRRLNLERSLRFGDRIHGHLVTGHVDSLGIIQARKQDGESLFLTIQVQDSVLPLVWKKGSVTVNGTSLTVNAVNGSCVELCLIPETQKRTNLGAVQVGDRVTIEPDYMARAIRRALDAQLPTLNEVKL